MNRGAAMLLAVVAGCGRFGFAPTANDGGPAADGPPVPRPVDRLACGAPTTLLPIDSVLADQAFWIRGSSNDYLIVLYHVAAANHPIRIATLTTDGTSLLVGAEQLLLQAQDPFIAVEPVAGGHLLVVSDRTSGTEAFPIVDGVLGTGTILPSVGKARRPFARDGAATLAVTGTNGANDLVVLGIAPDGAFATSAITTLELGAQQPFDPSIAGLASGFVVTWALSANSACRLARLDASLALVAGPIDVNLSHECQIPRVAQLGADRIAFTASDGATETISTVVYDFSLATVVAPQTVRGEETKLLADGDRVWLSSSGQNEELQTGWLSTVGDLTLLPAPGGLGTPAPWSHELSRADEVPVLLWDDLATSSVQATRLCR